MVCQVVLSAMEKKKAEQELGVEGRLQFDLR